MTLGRNVNDCNKDPMAYHMIQRQCALKHKHLKDQRSTHRPAPISDHISELPMKDLDAGLHTHVIANIERVSNKLEDFYEEYTEDEAE